jgi:hypothetical protein
MSPRPRSRHRGRPCGRRRRSERRRERGDKPSRCGEVSCKAVPAEHEPPGARLQRGRDEQVRAVEGHLGEPRGAAVDRPCRCWGSGARSSWISRLYSSRIVRGRPAPMNGNGPTSGASGWTDRFDRAMRSRVRGSPSSDKARASPRTREPALRAAGRPAARAVVHAAILAVVGPAAVAAVHLLLRARAPAAHARGDVVQRSPV